jgi:hypothetical protein
MSFEIDVTDEQIALYNLELKSKTKWYMDHAPSGVKYDWNPPKLNPDGSLAYEARKESSEKTAGSAPAWSGTRKV